MTTNPGEIGSLPKDPELQRRLAAASRRYICRGCGVQHSDLVEGENNNTEPSTMYRMSALSNRLLLRLQSNKRQGESREADLGTKEPSAGRSTFPELPRKGKRVSNPTAPIKKLGRLVAMRKVMLYSGTVLLLGIWKYFVDAVDRYFTARGSASTF
jgi:hypothetical protein